MSLTRQQVESWKPDQLNGLATAMNALGTRLEGYFDQYAEAITEATGQHWTGKCADAAADKACDDRHTIQQLVSDVEALTKKMTAAEGEIAAALRSAREQIALAEHDNGFRVGDDLTITDPRNSSDAPRTRLLAEIQSDLSSNANTAYQHDQQLARDIDNARDGLRVAFTAAQALGADQGRTDSADLATGHMSPEQYRRLIVAGRLTPEQLNALGAGQPVNLSAAQFEYINQLSRSLDGTSPQQIQRMMDSMPPDARQALANCFQIASTNTVSASVANDANLPNQGKGGLSLLPHQIGHSLTRSDLVQQSSTVGTGGSGANVVRLNGLEANQAAARIAGDSDPRYRGGSDLDRHVLDVGAQYLNAQTSVEQSSDSKFTSLQDEHGNGLDPQHARIAEDMFSAVGDDKAAVQGLITGPDGSQFIHDSLTHQWSDHGHAISSVYRFGPNDAIPADPHNPVDIAVAQRQGAIMSAVGQYAANDTNLAGLMSVAGTNHQTAGGLNPDLIRTLATSMSPCLDNLGGGHGVGMGFSVTDGHSTSWLVPSGNRTYHGAVNVFALMDTDDQAGRGFNAAALADVVRHEADFGHQPSGSDAGGNLRLGGSLQGEVDAGLRNEISAHTNDANRIALDAYNQKKDAYDAVRDTLAGSVPFGDDALKIPYADRVTPYLSQGGGDLENAIIGPAPSAQSTDVGLNAPNFYEQEYQVLANTDITPQQRAEYQDLFDSNGALRPWQDIVTDGGAQDQVGSLFEDIASPHEDDLRNGYDDVTRDWRPNDNQNPHNGR